MTVTRVPAPGPHGGDGAQLAAFLGVDPGSIVDLSASLNPCAPDAGHVVGKHLDAVGRYPDAAPATAALAAAIGVDGDRVVLTNGGAEAIALVAAEVGGSVDEPDFALYPRGAAGPRWRSNPHNPTGRLAGPAVSVQVWDEAFYPLAKGCWTSGDADHGAIVVGSLTKVFACPGLRAGYVLAPDPALARRVAARQTTWSVNALAAAAVPDLLALADLTGWASQIRSWRTDLVAVLRTAGLTPQPSDAPWVVVRAPGLRARLAPQGVVVRDCASFGMPDHARIAVPDTAGLARLADALGATDQRPRSEDHGASEKHGGAEARSDQRPRP